VAGPARAERGGAGLPPAAEEDGPAALAATAELHELAPFRSWLADEDFLRKVAGRLDEVQVSPLYLDERQRGAQVDRVLADAVEEYLDPARRGKLAPRLLAMADHLQAMGDLPHARAAATAARALAAGQPGSSIPFARLLVEKAFSRRPGPAAEAPTQDAAASPLIIAPR
jgi:hypothetical protein